MQTFLPYTSYDSSARCLDNKRLGKQRAESLQILETILENKKAWSHHPAVLMWRPYPGALILYMRAICQEWKSRGFQDICYDKAIAIFRESGKYKEPIHIPDWHGLVALHRSHRLALYTKNPVYYRIFGREAQYLPKGWTPRGSTKDIYLWPVRSKGSLLVEDERYIAYKNKKGQEL